MRALLVIAVATAARWGVHVGCDLSRRCHAVISVAGEYRDELRGQIELTA
jgi:hypothetical protein